ncbi:MAG: 5'-deoxynucleotidase [Ruthenibacterium sp.]
MKNFAFNALIARMKYITRWGLMRAGRAESLSEHTADTAILAHTLALVSVKIFDTNVRPETIAVAALYHDASEILTGDMPTPVKYKNETLRSAYKALEAQAADTLTALLPAELQHEMGGYLHESVLTPAEQKLLKAADRLSALIKCIDEEQSGNREFSGAKAQQTAALKAMECREADYFMQHMLPCYALTLDELSKA